jgi:hypothetical protein
MKETASDSQKKIWKVMRGMMSFTLPDIIEITGVSEATAKSYLQLLRQAGYLRPDGKIKIGIKKCHIQYRLIKDTGTQAPMKKGVIFDANLRKVIVPDHLIKEEVS